MGRPYRESFEEMINNKGDPSLGRFIKADSIVPGAGNPQAFGSAVTTVYNLIYPNALYIAISQNNYWKNLDLDMTLVRGGD